MNKLSKKHGDGNGKIHNLTENSTKCNNENCKNIMLISD